MFSSTPSTNQNGITLEGLYASIAPGASRTFVLEVFCMNQSLAPSNDTTTYSPAGVTPNAALLELAGMADGRLGQGLAGTADGPLGKALENVGLKAIATQQAVWVITDGPGFLTATQKGLLAAMYAATDDVTLLGLAEQFFATLPP